MNTILFVIIIILVVEFIFDKALDYLNMLCLKRTPELPKEAEGIYNQERYEKSRKYFFANYKFSNVTGSVNLLVVLLMLIFGGFAFVDSVARTYTEHPILLALLFFGLLGLLSDWFNTPFSMYRIFVIEEDFGFNRTTMRTFLMDKIRTYFLACVIGGGMLSLVIWIYESTGEYFWLLAWAVISLFTIFLVMFYTSLIVPLFNKLTPLPEGELRAAIEEYCRKVSFPLHDLYVMDSSRRSSKSNAYFSGLGKKKKIVLFDTLIEKHTVPEIVAVLAHEVGHYKKKHTLIGTVQSVIQTGIMLFIMSWFLDNPALAQALGAEQPSFHLNILAFGMLYSPISEVLGIVANVLSRKHEYEADRYAKETFSGDQLQNALKKLTADNLGNLLPHPAYVFVHYSHPPMLERLKNLRK